METYRVIIHESFENDSTKEIILDNQNIEQILSWFEKLDGKSLPALQISLSKEPYPYLYVIGGPDLFTFSLTTDEHSWQEMRTNPDPDTSKWRAFGLGYHNYEFFEDELCNKQVTIRVIKHFCTTGEWPIGIPSTKSEEIW
jgi:hypothetical protein